MHYWGFYIPPLGSFINIPIMKKITNIILIILLIVVICLYVAKKPTVVNPVSYEYITDTLYLDTLFVLGKPYPVPTPPRIVKEYLVDSSLVESLRINLNNQNIVINGLKDSLVINQLYLKQFPSNPKLLSASLSKDSLSLSLLNIQGKVSENIWPLNLLAFNYNWYNNIGLSRIGITHPPPVMDKTPFVNLYAGGGVNILTRSPYVSFIAQKSWTRIMLSLNTDIILLPNDNSSIKLGINYSLNGK